MDRGSPDWIKKMHWAPMAQDCPSCQGSDKLMNWLSAEGSTGSDAARLEGAGDGRSTSAALEVLL